MCSVGDPAAVGFLLTLALLGLAGVSHTAPAEDDETECLSKYFSKWKLRTYIKSPGSLHGGREGGIVNELLNLGLRTAFLYRQQAEKSR